MTVITDKPIEQSRVPEGTRSMAGIVELTDGKGHLRTAGYRRSATDIPLAPGQVRQYGLRAGDTIDATATVTVTVTGSGQRGRTAGLAGVITVNGLPADQARDRRHFDDLTPVDPHARFRLEDGSPSPAARIIDLVTPIGKGQRGLIVALSTALVDAGSQLDKTTSPNETFLRDIRQAG